MSTLRRALIAFVAFIVIFWASIPYSVLAQTDEVVIEYAVDDGVPLCTIIWYPLAGSFPSGYLVADGSTVNKGTYPTLSYLWSCLGYQYGGSGDSFVLPNLIGRFPLGTKYGAAYSVGSTGGADSHTLTVNEMPGHSHTERAATVSGYGSTTWVQYNSGASGSQFNTSSTTLPSGGGQPHNNMPPYLALVPLIKAFPVYKYLTTTISIPSVVTNTVYFTTTQYITVTIEYTAPTTPTPDAYTETLPSGKTLYMPIIISFGEIIMASMALGLCAMLGYGVIFGSIFNK